MKKQEFLVWRYGFVAGVDGLSMKYVSRVSGYLYGLEMLNGHQLPIGIYRAEKNGRKQWRVVDLLTGLAWDTDVDDRLMCLGEFSRPLRLTPLRLENMPQSCITYDSDGLRSQA